MAFIQKNLNFGLLLIIILLVGAITLLGIYYNTNYTTLSEEYSKKIETLSKVQEDLLYHKSRLNSTVADLEIKEQDESELGKRYADLRTDKEALDTENEGLRTDLAEKNAELVDKTQKLLDAQSEIASNLIRIDTLERQRNSCESDFDELCTLIKADPSISSTISGKCPTE